MVFLRKYSSTCTSIQYHTKHAAEREGGPVFSFPVRSAVKPPAGYTVGAYLLLVCSTRSKTSATAPNGTGSPFFQEAFATRSSVFATTRPVAVLP